MSAKSMSHYRQASVGVVFQAFNLIPSLSARENIEVVCRTAGRSRVAARERADELLEMVDLVDQTRKRPGSMSGGQQQRVAIARALAMNPPLVLADEPTAHLDYIQVEGVLNILRQLADGDRTVLVATHDERLLPLADRIVELSPRAAPAAAASEHRRLEDGEVLFEQGDAGSLVYIVDAGGIQLVRQRADGTEETVSNLAAGEYFGELAPLFGLPRSATARAIGTTELTGFPVSEFRSIMDKAGR
jgi:putative ABC transport system ATP-binding protein